MNPSATLLTAVAVFTAITLSVTASLAHTAGAQATSSRFAITHVTVIDVAHGRRLVDRTVIVEGNRIVQVERSVSLRVPSGTRVVDGRGKYLIPGLWDMHVHALQSGRAVWMFPLFLANGVTGIRDTGAPLDSLLYYRPRLRSSDMLGPRLVATGPILDEPPGPSKQVTRTVTSAEEARRAVDTLADAGVDFIKVYNELSRDEFFAIVYEARHRGIPVVGHVPFVLSAFEASDAGMKSIEHLTRVPEVCIPDSLARFNDAEDMSAHARRPAISPDSEQAMWVRMNAREAAGFDEVRCEHAGAHFARNGTWQVPTLEFHHRQGRRYLVSDSTRTDSQLRYVPTRVLAGWMRFRDSTVAHAWRGTDGDSRYPTYARVTRALVRGGGGLLAGTDVGNFWVMPGFGLHGELRAFVRDAGLTPLQALRSATLGPAEFLGATDSLGTVAAGRIADLVLLDADPLVDIGNTKRIRAVWTNGRYLNRASLDSLLSSVEH